MGHEVLLTCASTTVLWENDSIVTDESTLLNFLLILSLEHFDGSKPPV
jgi:hypothetical protein